MDRRTRAEAVRLERRWLGLLARNTPPKMNGKCDMVDSALPKGPLQAASTPPTDQELQKSLRHMETILIPEDTSEGQTCRCEVQAFDGFDPGPWGLSPNRVILADP